MSIILYNVNVRKFYTQKMSLNTQIERSIKNIKSQQQKTSLALIKNKHPYIIETY